MKANTKTPDGKPNLQISFDVGHSSIGWAVLQTHNPQNPIINLLGCGVVTFPADDCLASKRRDYRRQRRHARSTRQRIARLENLLEHLGAISKAELLRMHTQAKGHSKQNPHERRGASFPWLLAARILAARNDDETRQAKLSWPELWDVLRWYAHNRGYDGNIRWSGGFRIEAFSDVPQVSISAITGQAEEAKKSADDKDEDWKKLQAAAGRMADYGFLSPTFAETVAKFLFGPDRTVRPGPQGKPGIVEPTPETFSEGQFRNLLFHCEPGFENHSRHLGNYFKGLRAAFPRRIIKNIDGKATLVGGTEWEVRYILRHSGHLDGCDARFEQAVCGGIPEAETDWLVYEQSHPALYLSKDDKASLKQLRIAKKTSKAEKERLKEERRPILESKLAIPARYQGGLLFGQIVPRFDNRIIAQCPVTFSEEYQRQLDAGESPEDAKRKAEIIAKVPIRNTPEFLNFRWAMTVANIRVGFGNEVYDNGEKLRPLNPVERRKLDAHARRLGFLELEKDRPGTDGLVRQGKNKLAELIRDEIKCDRHNLETLLLHPDAKESLKLLPVDGDTAAFRAAWSSFGDPEHASDGRYHDSPLRSRFTIQLLRQKKLTLMEIIRQLETIGQSQVAGRIREAARKQASDKRGSINEDKLAKLMEAEFFCPKLKGRARFSRNKLRAAFQQVFHRDKPIHPLETGGCLEQTDVVKQAAMLKALAEQTNNHLVRHRLLILAGDDKAKPKPKNGLLQDIISEFAGDDIRNIARITVELARDLQEMSGMTNKDKAAAMTAKLEDHKNVAEDLAKKLRDDNGTPLRDANGRPFAASPGLIRKARILDDLGKQCPYTGHDIEFIHLAKPHPKFGTADKDHIIPRSQRLSDALEAQVITFSEINRLKSQKTALQFIREMNLPENRHHKDKFGFKSEARFRRDVDALWPPKDPFKRARAGGAKPTDDEARCWRRKELLLKASWDGKEFTPADLAKTRHIVKQAAQQCEAHFASLPPEERPPVIAITGAVTAAFRDKSWKLLGELAAVHPAVKEALAKGAKEWDAGKDFNPKKAVREITHLHHALDAIALGLVTSMLVPPKHRSLDGDLARFIVKGKLTVDKERGIDEVSTFHALCAKLRLPRFARLDNRNRLYIDELADSLKAQIRARLAEKRIVQHIPPGMSGMKVEENTRGVVKVENGRATLRQQKRNAEGIIEVKETEEVVGKLLGLHPKKGAGKLTPLKGVRVISDNFGVAILDHVADVKDRFAIIPHHKVWHRIQDLKKLNGGKTPRVLRNGQIIEIDSGTYKGTWRVFSIKNKKAGLKVNLGTVDCLEVEYDVKDPQTGKKTSKTTLGCKLDAALETMVSGNLRIKRTSLTGMSACPTTSSA
jgi:CRISPR-associated endonuclease Csn1